MCRYLKIGVWCAVGVGCAVVFFYIQGFQYVLAIVTFSLQKPNFDSSRFSYAKNCYGGTPCSSGDIRILTYNVLCRLCDEEGYESWDNRVVHLRDLIRRFDPDLIGTQELGGWKDVRTLFPQEDIYAVVTFEFGPWAYADSALFYRKAKYELLDSGQFWLSPNPHLPFGFAWLKISMPRYLCWAVLRDLQYGFTFLFLNVHLDNNTINKEKGAALIFEAFSPHALHMPIIFTGDFNTTPLTDRYEVLRRGGLDKTIFHNAAEFAPVLELRQHNNELFPSDSLVTFDDFDQMIDHIFLAGPGRIEVIKWIVDYNTYGEQPYAASDHPALFAVARLSISE